MRTEREYKDQLYQEFARIGKCLSSPRRLEIIDVLAQSPKSVDQLSKDTGMSIANASQHLQTLYEARLVRFSKKGNHVIYELSDPAVADFMVSLHRLGEGRLVEIQRIKTEALQMFERAEPVDMTALMHRMERGEALLVDVRPKEEYDMDHIPGAISIPMAELEERLSSLPRHVEIVAYCRGPYCFLSAQAAELLRSRGFRAFRLEEGVLEWRHAAGQVQG